MELRHRTQGSVNIVMPTRRIDQSSADEFQAALAPHLAACTKGGTPLVLDFSDVEYISSVGLRVLMLAARQTGAQGGRLVIAVLQPMVREVFEISSFDLVFKIFDDVCAAVEALS